MNEALPTYDCLDCRLAGLASSLLDTSHEVSRHATSSGHAYKMDLIEVFGAAGAIRDCRNVVPQNPACKVNPLFLANEIYLYVTSDAHPPIFRYWPWERVRDYYVSERGIERPYGYDFHDVNGRMSRLVRLLHDHPTTKRAVVSFYTPAFIENSGDTPCTLSTQYRIINGRLHTTTTFRSHDFFGGCRTDPMRISFVQQYVAACLHAMGHDTEPGPLVQFDGSVHYDPHKKHGPLEPIASWDCGAFIHDRSEWCLFNAEYESYAEVQADLIAYLSVVADANADAIDAIACSNLQSHAIQVLGAIMKAREKYGRVVPLTP